MKIICALVVSGSLFLHLGSFAAAEVKVSEATQACIECHRVVHPGIVEDWQRSRHAAVSPKEAMAVKGLGLKVSSPSVPGELQGVAVGCAECHTLRPKEHADTFEHNGYDIHIVVSPGDCRTCHAQEAEQYSRNIMAHAYKNLAGNKLYNDLEHTLLGGIQRKGGKWSIQPTIHLIDSPVYYNGESSDKTNDLPDNGTQVINYNRGYATGGEQHALGLVDDTVAGFIGYCCGKGPGTPGTCNRVTVDIDACLSPNEDENRLDQTIAHEIGHAINLWHHGQNTQHTHFNVSSDPAHGTTSGDMDCIMRYYRAYVYWCYPKQDEPDGCKTHTWGTQESAGTSFCTDPKGTGFNDWFDEFNNHATEGKEHVNIK